MDGSAATEVPGVVRRLDLPEADALARLAAVFEDLQHVLRCCEHLVRALAAPAPGPGGRESDAALAEALWTSALIAYARCFSVKTGVLARRDLDGLELTGEVGTFHDALLRLRDHYTSPHVNPLEAFTIVRAEAEDAPPVVVAVVATPQPVVDDVAVRQLGRIAYGLSGLLDARMQEAQSRVLDRARELGPQRFAALPVVQLTP